MRSVLPAGQRFIPARRARLFALIAGILSILLGSFVLIGWWLNIEILKSIIPGVVPLKPNMGAGFLLCGVALTLLSAGKQDSGGLRYGRLFAGGASALVLAMGALTLCEYFLNWDIGIDRWLVPGVTSNGLLAPGRMNPVTALGFVLVAGALLTASERRMPRHLSFPLIAGLGAASALVGILPLAGLGLEALLGPKWNFLGMSVSGIVGAASFLILGAGLLALIRSGGGLEWSLGRVTTVAFIAGILLASLTTAVAFNFAVQMLQANASVTHRQETLKELEAGKAGVAELLNTERLYVILGEERLLSERAEIKEALAKGLDTVRKSTIANPDQQRRLDEVESLLKERIEWEEKVIEARREKGLSNAAEMVATGAGIRLVDGIHERLKEMVTEEYKLLGSDRKGVEAAAIATFLLLPFGVFVTLAVLTLAVFLLNAGLAERAQSETALRESQAQLQTIVENLDEGIVVSDLNGNLLHWNPAALKVHGYPEQTQDHRRFPDLVDTFELSTLDGTVLGIEEWPLARILRGEDLRNLELRVHRLGTDWRRVFNYGGTFVHDGAGKPFIVIVTIDDITERKCAEQEIHQLNADLENRVAGRTAELEAANKELEAFSYSVSHDLRSPLRAVDGFSQALLEDYGEMLPKEGRKYLETIRQGAQRMGALIDDLLTFSRLSRVPLNKQAVSMMTLVREVLDQLRAQEGDRALDLRVGELPQCHGDPALLKQVWINLISNAHKYTRKREKALVEIGSTLENGEPVYFISDNGVGFDMQYAHKLFGVFQRLHRAEEFEGTGVGLAIVQRIVHRHGGRVWAEAELDGGAKFYFKLGIEAAVPAANEKQS